MSHENLDVVRAYLSATQGDDMVPLLPRMIEFDADIARGVAVPDAVAALSKLNPEVGYLDPAIEWDVSATGGLAGVYRGLDGFARYWIDWLEMWSSYVYRVVEYRDLGDWVLTPMRVEGEGRDSVTVGLLVFQMWLVRDGRIAVMRAYHDEAAAFEAVGVQQ
jgi:ketosteroid isomerase-like protein